MRWDKLAGSLLNVIGNAVMCIAGMLASFYILVSVVWLHAPSLAALFVAMFFAVPLCGVGWLLKRAAVRINPDLKPLPLYRIDEHGKMVRRYRKA